MTTIQSNLPLGSGPGLIDPLQLKQRQRELVRFVGLFQNVVRTPQGWVLRGDATGEHFTDRLVKSVIDRGLVRKELHRSRFWRLVLTGSGQNTLAIMDIRESSARGKA